LRAAQGVLVRAGRREVTGVLLRHAEAERIVNGYSATPTHMQKGAAIVTR
jgi:hypothetical protein